jgi:glycosyltransferase involved in cell wall biosynthesis
MEQRKSTSAATVILMIPAATSVKLGDSGILRTPTVAVCIGTYNQAQYLARCIESVLAQSYPLEEIWVSDDASTDGTQALMEEICAHYPAVCYHRHPENSGIARNLSWALSRPNTELIARIDSDDELEPGFVETLVGLMGSHPQAGYGHCDVYEIDSYGVPTRVRRLYREDVYETPEESLKKNANGYRVAANCILFRAAALKQANYYYANASWKAAEDWDLSVRMAILGWGNVYAAAPLARYRVWDDSGRARFKRKVQEIECVTRLYKSTLESEYIKRGWSTRVLRKNMRRRAVSFADCIDSPLLSEDEREICKSRLRELGDSFSLSVSIFLADAGFSPLVRRLRRAELRLKDCAKSLLREVYKRCRRGSGETASYAPAETRVDAPEK